MYEIVKMMASGGQIQYVGWVEGGGSSGNIGDDIQKNFVW
jgi:hypothetical protein